MITNENEDGTMTGDIYCMVRQPTKKLVSGGVKLTVLFASTALICSLVCAAAGETTIAEVIVKTGVEKLNTFDVWIDVLDAKTNGIMISVKVGGDLGSNEARKIGVAASSLDGRQIPLKFFTSGTVHPGNITFIDYLARPDAKNNLSSVTVKWGGELKKFPLLGSKN